MIPTPGIRCFVAIDLPATVREDLAKVQERLAMPGLRLVQPAQVHVTLKFLGEVPPAQLELVKRVLEGVNFTSFPARMKGIGSFPGKSIRVVWLGLEGEFDSLAGAVDATLRPLGFAPERRFSAHATLGRVKEPNREMSQALLLIMNSMRDLNLGDFVVDRFFLKKSTLTPRGPIYEDLQEYRARTP